MTVINLDFPPSVRFRRFLAFVGFRSFQHLGSLGHEFRFYSVVVVVSNWTEVKVVSGLVNFFEIVQFSLVLFLKPGVKIVFDFENLIIFRLVFENGGVSGIGQLGYQFVLGKLFSTNPVVYFSEPFDFFLVELWVILFALFSGDRF